jgi:hypothetical protein
MPFEGPLDWLLGAWSLGAWFVGACAGIGGCVSRSSGMSGGATGG